MTNIHGVLCGPTNSHVNPTLPEMTARRRTLPCTQKWPVMDKQWGHEAAVDKLQELIRKQLIMWMKHLVQKMCWNKNTHLLQKLSSSFCVFYSGVIWLQFLMVIFYHYVCPALSLPQHVNSDLYSHILCLSGSHLSPGGLLVVVHLVAQRLFPVDGFGLGGILKQERNEVNISC